MKKILVVFTGGTIESKVLNSTIDIDESAGYFLLELFKEKYKMDVEFDAIQPINILSENCTPNHWQILCNTLKKIDIKPYSGIIITHGTDTLPYTSALLGFVFHYINIPIIITASNYALGDENSNGLANFYNSVNFIFETGIPGIFTIYQDNKGRNIVYLASRLREADSYNDQFFSFGGVNLGEISDRKFLLNKNKLNPTYDMLSTYRENLAGDYASFNNQVFAIKPYPGLNYDFFSFKNKPKAILHILYHSGTACISEKSYSLPGFVKKCKDDGMDFYLISLKSITGDLYVTSRELLEYGAIPLQNISFEAAFAKLNIAYNQNRFSPVEFMKKELFFEFLPK